MAFEQTQLLVGDDERRLLGVPLEPQEPLEAGFEIVTEPDATNAAPALTVTPARRS
jgi:hypothetical protein